MNFIIIAFVTLSAFTPAEVMVSPETNDFAEMIYYTATKKNKETILISINKVYS